jgi:diacylglycerol kinase family enzyme
MINVTEEKPVRLVVNPHSGYGGHAQALSRFRAELRSARIPLVEYVTTAPADATRYARDHLDQTSVFIAWGGDGTVNEIVSGVAGSDVPVLPSRAGTENLLAGELGVPSHPAGMVDVLRRGHVEACDVGIVNDRVFLLILGVGFDAEVVRRLSASRRGHISHLSYFWPIWRTFWEHDFPRLRIVADGEEIFDDFGLAFVGNISRYSVGLRICRDARFDDGLLDLVVFSCRKQTALMLHAAWTLLRRHPLKGNVLYRQVRELSIQADRPEPVQIDGDLGPNVPLDISVRPRRVNLLIPPPQQRHTGLWPWTGPIV